MPGSSSPDAELDDPSAGLELLRLSAVPGERNTAILAAIATLTFAALGGAGLHENGIGLAALGSVVVIGIVGAAGGLLHASARIADVGRRAPDWAQALVGYRRLQGAPLKERFRLSLAKGAEAVWVRPSPFSFAAHAAGIGIGLVGLGWLPRAWPGAVAPPASLFLAATAFYAASAFHTARATRKP